VSIDGYILSGHRRYVAASLAGLTTVPARMVAVRRSEDPDTFVRLLREYNRHRDKTLAEQVREEVVSVAPTEAYAALLAARQAPPVAVPTVEIEGTQRRKAISRAKAPMLAAVMTVLTEVLQPYLPTSDRKIHYELLNDPPLRHASKPQRRYRNTPEDYDDLTNLLTRARIAGLIPWEWITDETRPCEVWQTWPDPRQFVRAQLDGLLQGYWRNLQQTQPHHIEIVVEKNTVHSIVRGVAMEYCIPITSLRGFSAIERYHQIRQRYTASGKARLILLALTDFDPEGEEIVQVAGRTMRDDFHIATVDVVKVCLTAAQVRQMQLPSMIAAKETSSRYENFVHKYGTTVYELEALAPPVQQDLLRQAIDGVLDIEAFNAELEREKADAAWLATRREQWLARLGEDLQAL
jgi:hypothetical protein